jgi:hypothetical protein
MSSEVSIIFPNQLYKQHPAVKANRPVYLIEEWHFFNQYNFHKEKLVLHRASMKFYEQFLKEQGLATPALKIHVIGCSRLLWAIFLPFLFFGNNVFNQLNNNLADKFMLINFRWNSTNCLLAKYFIPVLCH